MSQPHQEAVEIAKVGGVGVAGTLASMGLSDVATIVSIGVGLATFTYVCSKIYFLFKNHGKSSD